MPKQLEGGKKSSLSVKKAKAPKKFKKPSLISSKASVKKTKSKSSKVDFFAKSPKSGTGFFKGIKFKK